MKQLFLMAALLVNSQLFASDSRDFLSHDQKEDILSSIDSVCGDTWCEGDFDFRFTEFSCNQLTSVCILNFHFIKNEEDAEDVFSPLQTCEFKNISNFKQIKASAFTLDDSFFSELTECISLREKEVQL